MTSTKTTPRPQVTVVPSMDLNLSWLLGNINENLTLKFSIDRSKKHCHTPRRIPEIDAALVFFRTYYSWSQQVATYFTQLFSVQAAQDLSKINDSGIFVPVGSHYSTKPVRMLGNQC